MTDVLAPSAYRVERAISAWMSARSRLLNEDTDLAHDEAALSDLLGAEEGDIRDILARLLRAALHAKSMAEAAVVRIEDMTARRDRYKRRAEAMRGTAFAIMDVLGERKIELPDLTVTIRAGTVSAIITNEAALDDRFVKVVTERRPDKAAILTALKDGEVITGAELANGMPSLAIRSK